MGCAAADPLSHSTPNDSVPCGAPRDGKFQRVVLEQPNPGLSIATFWPPTGNHFDEARCNCSRIDHAAVQENGVGPAGAGVRVQEARQLSRDRGVLRVRQSELLKGNARGATRQFVRAASWKKAFENDSFDIFTQKFCRHRCADKATAFSHRPTGESSPAHPAQAMIPSRRDSPDEFVPLRGREFAPARGHLFFGLAGSAASMLSPPSIKWSPTAMRLRVCLRRLEPG